MIVRQCWCGRSEAEHLAQALAIEASAHGVTVEVLLEGKARKGRKKPVIL